MIAALVAAIGDFELAEECLQDAVELALKDWSLKGIPRSRRGWLLQVGRRRALDRLRRNANFRQKAAQIAVLEQVEFSQHAESHDIPDHRLRLIFTCCHPALEQKTRVALTLRTLGGLSTQEVARAFLDKTPAMAQRLARARSKISKAGIPFVIPDGDELPARMGSVLSVIYLIFNEGYVATEGDTPIRTDLCDNAIFLARLMVDLSPETPEAAGLLALILLTHARRAARYGVGCYIPLASQDRSLWDQARIKEGQRILETALKQGRAGPYQIQASIAALHCEAKKATETDWQQITQLYRHLVQLEPSAVVRLNHAVAVSYSDGPGKALDLLEGLATELAQYQPYHAARADILCRLMRKTEAVAAFDMAIYLSKLAAEREFLKARRAEIGPS